MKPLRCGVCMLANSKDCKVYADKFSKVLNVNIYTLIVMCVVLEGLVTDYMAKGNYIGLATVGD